MKMDARNFLMHRLRQFGTLGGLLLLSGVLWALSPYFLSVSNLLNIAEQTATIATIAAGMTFVIISGGIDLSVGSVLAFAGVVMASALHAGVGAPLGIAVALGAGALCGALNGFFITFGKLPPFIATLGMMSVARGAALMFTEGRPVSGFSESFRFLAVGQVFHVAMPVIIMLVLYAVAHLALTRTKLGRYTYAIGGNEKAAILAGVNVKLYKIMIYALAGLLAGLAAIILTARLNSAQPIAGINYELDAIAAAVIGGASLMGGEGAVFGTLIGALIMGVLRNGLNLLGISSFAQQVAIGSIIIIAVFFDVALKPARS